MWPVEFGYLLRKFGPSAVQASLVRMSYMLAFTVFAGMDILGKAHKTVLEDVIVGTADALRVCQRTYRVPLRPFPGRGLTDCGCEQNWEFSSFPQRRKQSNETVFVVNISPEKVDRREGRWGCVRAIPF